MGSTRKTLDRILSGRADRSIRFDALCAVLRALGFDERTRGGHRIFTREGVEEIINLQPRQGGEAKPYQVKQVRAIITQYKLGMDDDE